MRTSIISANFQCMLYLEASRAADVALWMLQKGWNDEEMVVSGY
jgi:hypothetical protein